MPENESLEDMTKDVFRRVIVGNCEADYTL